MNNKTRSESRCEINELSLQKMELKNNLFTDNDDDDCRHIQKVSERT